ncbi:MAG: hypothetical protein K6C36_07895 [Clostridia bacterium]|nr:hypothetical protein [Clostridia bacterium]
MYQLIVKIGLIFTILFQTCFGFCRPVRQNTVPQNGSLAATDSLGRSVVSAGESEKLVGIFYFLFNGDGGENGPYDVTKIIETDPQAYLSGERWEAAGGGPFLSSHHWGEPLFGYYFQTDKWVLSRHCQMLTDAGVDFIVFDTTNNDIYIDRVTALIDVWYSYYLDGWNVPKLAFYTNTDSGNRMNQIYDAYYNNAELKAKYPRLDELWFRLNGKPMIVGWKDSPDTREDVKSYFRMKASQWPSTDDPRARDGDGFPWIEFVNLETLNAYYKNSPFDKSIMSVSVAQHCDTVHMSSSAFYGHNDHGRSWHDGAKDTSENAVLYGYNFAEQWEYAMKLDPDIIFITGFNEWMALRLSGENEPILFFDECDAEYSRDVEPAKGILGDNYYMQMVDCIAKFKRSTASLPRGKQVAVDLSGDFSQWDDPEIKAVYRDYRNDTADRDHPGYGANYYTDDSGRNDIVNAKVCEDSENLYFYVDTAEALSPSTDDAWMTLFVNVGGSEGYDLCVNRTSPECGKTTVEAVRDGGYERLGDADIRFEGSRLMLSVEKSLLGFAPGEDASFTFKWADNYVDGDIYSFYTGGDAAPYGRLNWVY